MTKLTTNIITKKIQEDIASTDWKLLTKTELAAKLTVCLRSVDNLISDKAIDVVRIGKCVRFRPDSVAEYLRASTINAN